jgi:mono/diheme cytochrome c family protein
MTKATIGLASATLAVGLFLGFAGSADATVEMQKKAKAAGFAESTNCLYCHNEKLPKKGGVTNNERGKWLVDQKEKKGAKEIDFAWLKDFAPAKK